MGRSGRWNWNQGKKAERMDDEDVEFIRAVDRFRLDTRRIPPATDYLAILEPLGYCKVAGHAKHMTCVFCAHLPGVL